MDVPSNLARFYLNARLNANPSDGPTGPSEKDCHRRTREAERHFRVSKGYVRDTLRNRLKFRLFYNY